MEEPSSAEILEKNLESTSSLESAQRGFQEESVPRKSKSRTKAKGTNKFLITGLLLILLTLIIGSCLVLTTVVRQQARAPAELQSVSLSNPEGKVEILASDLYNHSAEILSSIPTVTLRYVSNIEKNEEKLMTLHIKDAQNESGSLRIDLSNGGYIEASPTNTKLYDSNLLLIAESNFNKIEPHKGHFRFSRRLATRESPGMPQSFMDAYCRYGCGGMSVTFPYYYRPFFGYGYPLVGTEAMFPNGYGGNPNSPMLASQALMNSGEIGNNNALQYQIPNGGLLGGTISNGVPTAPPMGMPMLGNMQNMVPNIMQPAMNAFQGVGNLLAGTLRGRN